MKSVFEKDTREELLQRINALTPGSKPLWGKMNVAQMVKHCCVCEEYYFGNVKVSRSFLGRLIGKMALKGILKDENAVFRKNSPTSPPFKVTGEIDDLENEKQKWRSLMERYELFDKESFTHWFFGPMTKDELGQFIYKHSNHHLTQFGV